MKKALIIILIAIVVAALWGIGKYNGLVSQDENVKKTWANVEAQYQRRSDLIPNLVSTVKGYAKHEQQTFEQVVAARAKATQITVDADNLTPEKLQAYQRAQGDVTTALGKLLAVAENYPELKANENFSELQAQLEGTENRINESRRQYNEAVQTYNKKVRSFPTNIVAGLCGFDRKESFKADEGAERAPQVSFD